MQIPQSDNQNPFSNNFQQNFKENIYLNLYYSQVCNKDDPIMNVLYNQLFQLALIQNCMQKIFLELSSNIFAKLFTNTESKSSTQSLQQQQNSNSFFNQILNTSNAQANQQLQYNDPNFKFQFETNENQMQQEKIDQINKNKMLIEQGGQEKQEIKQISFENEEKDIFNIDIIENYKFEKQNFNTKNITKYNAQIQNIDCKDQFTETNKQRKYCVNLNKAKTINEDLSQSQNKIVFKQKQKTLDSYIQHQKPSQQNQIVERITYRTKENKQQLQGYTCKECKKFLEALGEGFDIEKICDKCSRHRTNAQIKFTPTLYYEDSQFNFQK